VLSFAGKDLHQRVWQIPCPAIPNGYLLGLVKILPVM